MAWLGVVALAAGASAGCGSSDDFGDPWLTEAEFEFGEAAAGGGEAAFGQIGAVRVLENGERVLVVEPSALRVTIWTPDGTLVREVGGGGEGPGQFSGPLFVEVHRDGFRARDSRRYTSFASDGTLLDTVPFPPATLHHNGFRLGTHALLGDGSFLAVPQIPATAVVGFGGFEPIVDVPILHVRAEGDEWATSTIAMLDSRNRYLSIAPQGTPFEERGIRMAQFFGDFDLTWFDPGAGSVVVLRRNMPEGAVELIEIDAAGDTLWSRRVSPSPVPLDRDRLATFIDDVAERYAAVPGAGGGEATPVQVIRDAIEEAVHAPDPLPGATRVLGSASGEIWFEGYPTRDSLSVWHAIRRDDMRGRRVLLPPGFRAMDATDSHVWGVRTDEHGVNRVVGRRLTPPQRGGR